MTRCVDDGCGTGVRMCVLLHCMCACVLLYCLYACVLLYVCVYSVLSKPTVNLNTTHHSYSRMHHLVPHHTLLHSHITCYHTPTHTHIHSPPHTHIHSTPHPPIHSQTTTALAQQPPPADGTPLPCTATPQHVLRLKKLGNQHILAVALSPDGKVRVQFFWELMHVLGGELFMCLCVFECHFV